MRIATWNLNGIRAAHKKGLDHFIKKIDADVLLFQEVRALPEQMPVGWKQPQITMSYGTRQKKLPGVMTCSKDEIIEMGENRNQFDDTLDPDGKSWSRDMASSLA